MDITYQYTKKRSSFGRQVQFCEHGPEMCDSVAASPAEQKMYILRNPVHQPTQHTPSFSENHINTYRADYSSSGANHAEGGWPKDVHVTDPEATQRYRRKIEKDDGYIHCVMSLSDGVDHYILQNNAIDMYEIYYSKMSSLPPIERNNLRTVNVYRDTGGNRPISSISWQPESGHHFVVTYVDVDFNRNSHSPFDCYIWNLDRAMSPEVTITPPCPALDLRYNGRDVNVLAGGLVSGQVALWDRRLGGKPVNVCPPHVAHRDLVRNVIFISSKSGQEFFSSGPDGACKWWDCRKLNDYTDLMIIDVVKSANDVQSMATSYGVSVLEYEPTIPTRFMVGTENGLIIAGNRKGKSPTDQLPGQCLGHSGPVYSLERNPGFMKNFMSVGDWTVRVWSEDCKESAVIFSAPQRHKLTCGTWSPTRLSLLLVSAADGSLAAWDLLRRHHAPALCMQVCHEPLLKVCMQEGGSLAACGSGGGRVFMVELSPHLTVSDANDKAMLTAIFERESKRERILEAKLREIRLKARQAEEGSPRHSLAEPSPASGDLDLVDAANDYFAQLKKG